MNPPPDSLPPETEPCSCFLFLPGLNKDLVGAENHRSESELSLAAHRLRISALLRAGVSRVPVGCLGCENQGQGRLGSTQGIRSVNPAQTRSFGFSTAPPPPPSSLLGFQELDWTDFGGEIRKSGMARASSSGEPQPELLWQRAQGLAPCFH